MNTLFFVLGISAAFFLLGFGFTALGMFFEDNRIWFARISGFVMILMGLYQLDVFGQSKMLSSEHRMVFRLERWIMGPLPALVLGFTFSFAWTPCVGPTLGSVLLMAGSTGSAGKAALLIGVYTIGFVIPFLAVGMFTGKVLDFFKKHGNVVKYTVKIGAALLILMGIMTLTGFMNGMTNYLSDFGGLSGPTVEQEREEETEQQEEQQEEQQKRNTLPAPDFVLTDQFGKEHTLSDYKGKTVFLNFWATWCPPCRSEMPEIQNLYEIYGKNEGDLVVLGVAAPGYGGEGSVDDIIGFLDENGYSFPVVMDKTGEVFYTYGIRAYPTTFMIDSNGNVYGYVQGAITGYIMESIVQQTMEAVGENVNGQ
jgi:cytochrome c-type biogenesis protein